MSSNKIITVAIIGGGPAGMSSAIQLNRYGIKSLLLFDKKEHNSLLLNARFIENYIGFPNGISGIDLWNKFYEQFTNNNIPQIFSHVNSLDFNEQEQLFIITVGTDIYYSKYVIVASGTNPKKINFAGKNIYYEITKIIEQKNKEITIIGAGDAAFDYALSMAKANKVNIFNRGTNINALPALQKQVNSCDKIKYHTNTNLIKIKYNNTNKQCLVLQQPKNILEKNFDYLIMAIGRFANKTYYTTNLCRIEDMLMKNKLLYLIGDVKNNIYRQIAIAVADGILVAMQLKEQIG